jgi:tRNA threonylcarbamoyladenosine modification (KEOPS) complex Cgi121 subunit
MELFNMYRQLADLWRNTGELYVRVDGERQHTETCFRLGAESLEKAAALLAISTKSKELEIAELEEKMKAESEEG